MNKIFTQDYQEIKFKKTNPSKDVLTNILLYSKSLQAIKLNNGKNTGLINLN